jgi:hypothetical protein
MPSKLAPPRIAPLTAVLLTGALCSLGGAQERTLIVAPHKVPVTGSFPGLCFLVTDETEAEWTPLCGGIEGFVYEWGYRYRLRVVEVPEAGGAQPKLRLVNVVSQRDVRADYTFEIPLTAARVVRAPNGTFYVCGEKQFAFADGVNGADFAKAIASGARLNCKFRFSDDNTQPMVLLTWSPAGAVGPSVGGSGEISSDAPPLVREGRTLVPLRAIFEWLGAEVDYDFATREITATKDSHAIRVRIGSPTASVDGATIPLDVAATEAGGRTYVPLRFVSEAFGAEVDWDAEARTVTVIDRGRVGTLRVP